MEQEAGRLFVQIVKIKLVKHPTTLWSIQQNDKPSHFFMHDAIETLQSPIRIVTWLY